MAAASGAAAAAPPESQAAEATALDRGAAPADVRPPPGAASGADGREGGDGPEAETQRAEGAGPAASASDARAPVSKNQLKRLKRQAMWEDKREDRKRKRKEKRHERQARRRTERDAVVAEAEASGQDPREVLKAMRPRPPKRAVVPVALVLDCDFEEYMRDAELVSLASQIVRCYSHNRTARNHVHLMVCPWRGKLRDRFERVMGSTHLHWHGTHFVEGDFVEACKQAHEIMRGPNGGTVIDFLKSSESPGDDGAAPAPEPAPAPAPAPAPGGGTQAGPASSPSVVYLTADSPHTLERLEPYTCYVIGGIVDKNREKGLCYRRAEERGIRTAKLPIGEYMQMQSRQVLATNHVVDIMSKWLDCGDWASAFLRVIPKRKGGTLKGDGGEGGDGESDEGEDRTEAAGSEEPQSSLEGTPPGDVADGA